MSVLVGDWNVVAMTPCHSDSFFSIKDFLMSRQDEIISSKWWEECTQWGTYFWKPNKKDIVSDWISEVAVRWKHSQSAQLPSVSTALQPLLLQTFSHSFNRGISAQSHLCFSLINQVLSGLLGSQRPQQAGDEATCDNKLETRIFFFPPWCTVLQLLLCCLPHCVQLMHMTVRLMHTHTHTPNHGAVHTAMFKST